MSANQNPLESAVEQALDAFLFAPIGLVLDGPAGYDKLVANGKNQVTTARMMGQFAVQMGRSELEKRAATLDGPLADVLRGFGLIEPPAPKPRAAAAPAPAATKAPAPKAPAPKAPTAKAPAKKAPAKKAAAKRTVTIPSVGTLAIPDYDSLSASQVVSRLQGLSTKDLEAVRLYESAKRARKTILSRVLQLQK